MARASKTTGRARAKHTSAPSTEKSTGGPESGLRPTPPSVAAPSAAPRAWTPSHEEIELVAYYRYVARGGCPEGALEDWLHAERELLSQRPAEDATRA